MPSWRRRFPFSHRPSRASQLIRATAERGVAAWLKPPSRTPDRRLQEDRRRAAVPKKREECGAWKAKVKRTAYRAVNVPTSTHLRGFSNNSRGFSVKHVGCMHQVVGECPKTTGRGQASRVRR